MSTLQAGDPEHTLGFPTSLIALHLESQTIFTHAALIYFITSSCIMSGVHLKYLYEVFDLF